MEMEFQAAIAHAMPVRAWTDESEIKYRFCPLSVRRAVLGRAQGAPAGVGFNELIDGLHDVIELRFTKAARVMERERFTKQCGGIIHRDNIDERVLARMNDDWLLTGREGCAESYLARGARVGRH